MQAAEAAKLDPKKLESLGGIAGEFNEAIANVDQSDRGRRRRLTETYRRDIQAFMQSLTAEQRDAILKAAGEQVNDRGDRRGRRGGRQGRRGGDRAALRASMNGGTPKRRLEQ
jgi:hypothetical protein